MQILIQRSGVKPEIVRFNKLHQVMLSDNDKINVRCLRKGTHYSIKML